MENASKALLMAGGILIIIILISLVVLMHGKIGDYQQSKYSDEKTAELTTFNKQFTGYDSTSVYGYDLISLINKVTDYNKTYEEKGDDYQPIKVTVKMGEFGKTYGIEKSAVFFTKATYIVEKENNEFQKQLNDFADLEKKYNLKTLNLLSANYDAIVAWEKCDKDVTKDKTGTAKSPSKITGGLVGDEISSKDIEKWREYSEFKKATFKCDKVSYYDNGQVKQLDFTFVK